ncbi:MAG: hypothetical protein GY851_00300 [bacterium]|nr:hypothetical protein [bacterium]
MIRKFTIAWTLAAMCALAPIAGAQDAPGVVERLSSGEPDVRNQAAADAAALGAEAVPPIGALVGSDTFYTSQAAERALANLTHHAARPSADAERTAVAGELVKLIADTYPDKTRREALRLLAFVGGEAQVAPVAALLMEQSIADEARLALDQIPGEAASKALLDTLYLAPPELRVLLFDTLVHRNVRAAIPAITAEARGNHRDVAFSALEALARFGVPPHQVFPKSPAFTADEKRRYAWAFLTCAHARHASGDAKAAERMYASVAAFPPNKNAARAALRGLADLDSRMLIDHALGYLTEPGLSDMASTALIETKLDKTDALLTKAYERVVPAKRAALLNVLAARKAPGFDALAQTAAAQGAGEERMTALQLLGQPVPVDVLQEVLVKGTPWAREEAAQGVLDYAGQKRKAGEIEAARLAYEELAVSPVAPAYRLNALRGVEAVASYASREFVDSLLEVIREGQDGIPADAVVAAGRAAVAVYAANPDAEQAKQSVIALAEECRGKPGALDEVAMFAFEKLAALGVNTKVFAQRQGFITDWTLLGPLPNEGGIGAFEQSFFDEAANPLPSPVTVGDAALTWKPASTDAVPATIDLTAHFELKDNVAAYACAEVTVGADTPVLLLAGSDDGCEIWVNGAKVHAVKQPRSLIVDNDRIETALKAGVNRVLIKVLQGASDWQFCVRVAGRDGAPIDLSQGG